MFSKLINFFFYLYKKSKGTVPWPTSWFNSSTALATSTETTPLQPASGFEHSSTGSGFDDLDDNDAALSPDVGLPLDDYPVQPYERCHFYFFILLRFKDHLTCSFFVDHFATRRMKQNTMFRAAPLVNQANRQPKSSELP